MQSLLAALLPIAAATVGPEHWARVRTPHFELLSDADAERARQAALRLERLGSALDRLFPDAPGEPAPVVVLAFRDRSAFLAFVPRRHGHPRAVDGFFLGGTDCDYAVLTLAGARGTEPVEHEYAHLVLNRALPAQPVWVAEGLAEMLSGGELAGSAARLGAERPEHVAAIARGPRLLLSEVLATGFDSPLYHDDKRNGMLYAESWALMRWVVARHGLAALRPFLADVASGTDGRAAFARHFGDASATEATLLDVPPGPLLESGIEDAGVGVTVEAASRSDVQLRLGDLQLHAERLPEARRHFEQALAAEPASSAAHAGLAQVLLREGRWTEARQRLRVALELRPDDPVALLRHARLLAAEAAARGDVLSPEAEQEAASALERAVERAPRLAEAALMLARLRPNPVAHRIALLEAAFKRNPGWTELGTALAGLHAKRNDVAAARATLIRARDAAREPAYRFLCAHLLQRVDGAVAATAEARGRLTTLECRPDGSLLFHIETSGGAIALEAASPRSVFLDDGSGGPLLERDLTCGPQALEVLARYVKPGPGSPQAVLLSLTIAP